MSLTPLFGAWRRLDEGRDRSEFYRMWRVGTAAGFTVTKSMETMGARAAPLVESLRRWLLDGARRGEGVASLVRRGRSRLDPFESALLLLGDETGRIEESLALLAEFYARKHRLMLKVRSQMAYPLFTAIAATVIAPVPLLLPGRATAYVVTVALGLTGWLVAGGAIVTLFADAYGRKPPLVRARFARALETATEAGLPRPRALRLAADASADESVKTFIRALDETTLSRQPLTATLAGCPLMTPDLLAAIQVAEATGDFGVVRRFAELYEDGFR